MSPAWLRTRAVKRSDRNPRGRSFQVLYRRGGRAYKVESAGSFKTEREARIRRDLISGWLAAGLNPKLELAKLTEVEHKTPERWRDEWLRSLHHATPKTLRVYEYGANHVLDLIRPAVLGGVSVQDCELAVGQLAEAYSPATVQAYWAAFAQLLDYAGVEPNPARDRRVRLPRKRRLPVNPPPAEHVTAMLTRLPRKYVLPFVLIEQTAMRVESLEKLTWAVIDITGGQVRVTEKAWKTRFVPVPRWLIRQLEASCPVEDRGPERRLFPTVTAAGLRAAMRTACQVAGIPHYHPHDLRHRRASLWHLGGIPDAVLAQYLGHERSSFTKATYVHVMPVTEVADERLEALIVEAAR